MLSNGKVVTWVLAREVSYRKSQIFKCGTAVDLSMSQHNVKEKVEIIKVQVLSQKAPSLNNE